MRRALVILLLLSAPGALAAGPTRLTLDGARSSFVVHLFRAGLAARMAHDHVIRARNPQGWLELDGPLQSARLRIEVDARTLEIDPPRLRRRYKLPGTLDEAERRKIARNLHSEAQLFTKRYGRILFVSTGVVARGGDRYRLSGKLTLRGVTRDVTLEIRARRRGEQIVGSGQLRLLQSHFGYSPYRAALGLVQVKDEVVLDLYLVAGPRPPRGAGNAR